MVDLIPSRLWGRGINWSSQYSILPFAKTQFKHWSYFRFSSKDSCQFFHPDHHSGYIPIGYLKLLGVETALAWGAQNIIGWNSRNYLFLITKNRVIGRKIVFFWKRACAFSQNTPSETWTRSEWEKEGLEKYHAPLGELKQWYGTDFNIRFQIWLGQTLLQTKAHVL